MSNSERQIPSEIGVAVDEMKRAAIFLTRVPARLVGHDTSRAPDFHQGARVFPVIGALVGVAGGIVLVVAMWIGVPALVAAGLAIGTTVLVTGGLHEDGLADTADSFGGATTDQRLAIMDDSRVGTYGALALIAAEAVSRAALVRLWHDLPAVRPGGLSNDTGPPDQNAMLVALAVAAVLAIVLGVPAIGFWPVILAGALAVAATYGMIRLAGRTLGGRTGDTLGACQQVAMIAFLVGASIA
jgi:adenosylcobinamide-GDP ribazoletransferase